MKKIIFIITALLLFIQCDSQESKQLKRYDVKSAMITYNSTISGSVMGGTVKGSGTKNLYFTNYGALELQEEKNTQTTNITVMGRTMNETNSSHSMSKLDNGEQYIVNFKQKTIAKSKDPLMEMFKNTETDVVDAGKKMLESMGGKQIGTENYSGYECEIWSILGGKQWMHKGIPLKIEITLLDIKTTTQATSIKLDVKVPSDKFKLPNFPIKEQESIMGGFDFDNEVGYEDMEEIKANMKEISKLSFKEWKEMALKNDEEMREMSEEELKETYDMIQKMAKKLDK